ncbi:hypothetical protein [Fimbriiglobus ruber]|uniref:hypothetical protein n=1 Tax=Fimbriiglobus ruber TaxID=1908690 RepID=UPI000B4A760C|nr:hypothetical protein [Fimbriiglobus ruber]
MTAAAFYKLVLALWGEEWRPELRKLLEAHGHSYSRQSVWNWKAGKSPVPEPVAFILEAERKRRKEASQSPDSTPRKEKP